MTGLRPTVLFFFILGYFITVDGFQTNIEELLWNGQTQAYGSRVRPIQDSSQTIEITIDFNLLQLIDMNERAQRLEISGNLIMSWTDYKLGWKPADVLGLLHITGESTTIWIPDIGQSNSLDGGYNLAIAVDLYNLLIDYTGKVVWTPGGVFKTGCDFDITLFPFDTQQCTFTFESSTAYNDTLLLLTEFTQPINTTYSQDSQWLFTESSQVVTTYQTTSTRTKSRLTMTMTFRRMFNYYMVNIVAPCILLSILTIMVFYLPHDSGERIGFGITVLLAFSVFALIIADTLPRSSLHTSLLSIYLLTLMTMSTVSVMVSVCTMNAHYMCIGEKGLPGWMRNCVFGCLATVTCFKDDVLEFRENSVAPESDSSDVSEGTSLHTITETDSLEFANKIEDLERVPVPLLNKMTGTDPTTKKCQEILAEIKKLTKKMEADKRESYIMNEWKISARILDRFFLLVTLAIEFTASIFCLGIIAQL